MIYELLEAENARDRKISDEILLNWQKRANSKIELSKKEFENFFSIVDKASNSLSPKQKFHLYQLAQQALSSFGISIQCLFAKKMEISNKTCNNLDKDPRTNPKLDLLGQLYFFRQLLDKQILSFEFLLASKNLEKINIILKNNQFYPAINLHFLSRLAMITSDQNPSKSFELYEEILTKSNELQLDAMHHTTIYNLFKGLIETYLDRNYHSETLRTELEKWHSKIPFYYLKLKAIPVTSKFYLYVLALDGLYNSIYKNNPQECIKTFSLARSRFLQSKQADWAADCLRNIASCHVKAGRVDLGFQLNRQAEEELVAAVGELGAIELKNIKEIDLEIAKAKKDWDTVLKLSSWLIDNARRDQIEKQQQSFGQYSAMIGLEASDNRRRELELATQIQQKELESIKIVKYSSIGLGVLTLFLIITIIRMIQTKKRIRIKNQTIEKQSQNLAKIHNDLIAILNSTNDIIIKIDNNLIIDTISSSLTKNIFPTPIHKMPFSTSVLNYLDCNEDKKNQVLQILEILQESDSIAWELNEGNLPLESKIFNRDFSLHWHPILSESRLQAVLLVLRDITDENKAKALKVEKEQQNQILFEILSTSPQSAREFIKDLSDGQFTSGDVTHRKKTLHTAKGIARSLGLKKLANAIHNWEQNLENEQDFYEIFKEYKIAIAVFSGENQSQNRSFLFSELCNLAMIGILENLQQKGMCYQSIMITWDGSIQESEQNAIKTMLLHGITNSIDHGYIRPFDEGKSHNRDIALTITFAQSSSGFTLTIRDFGYGWNETDIQQKAKTTGRIIKSAAEISEYLFEEGVSTSLEANLLSGRGVGLAAIKSAVLALNGQVYIHSYGIHKGTELLCQWPIKK